MKILEPVNPRSLNKEFSTRSVDGGIVCSSQTVDCSVSSSMQSTCLSLRWLLFKLIDSPVMKRESGVVLFADYIQDCRYLE